MREGGSGQTSEQYFRDRQRKRVPQKKWRGHKNIRPESGKNMLSVIATDSSSHYF